MSKSYLEAKIRKLSDDKIEELIKKYDLVRESDNARRESNTILQSEFNKFRDNINKKIKKFGYILSGSLYIESKHTEWTNIGHVKCRTSNPVLNKIEAVKNARSNAIDKIHLTKDLLAAFEEFKKELSNI